MHERTWEQLESTSTSRLTRSLRKFPLGGRGIFLTATRRPESISMALRTAPKVPSPRYPRSSTRLTPPWTGVPGPNQAWIWHSGSGHLVFPPGLCQHVVIWPFYVEDILVRILTAGTNVIFGPNLQDNLAETSISSKAERIYLGVLVSRPVAEHYFTGFRMKLKGEVDPRNGGSLQDEVGIPSHFHNYLGSGSLRYMITDFKAISIPLRVTVGYIELIVRIEKAVVGRFAPLRRNQVEKGLGMRIRTRHDFPRSVR